VTDSNSLPPCEGAAELQAAARELVAVVRTLDGSIRDATKAPPPARGLTAGDRALLWSILVAVLFGQWAHWTIDDSATDTRQMVACVIRETAVTPAVPADPVRLASCLEPD